MDEITEQIRRVQRFVATAGITKTRIAALASIPLTTLIGMEKSDWNPRSTTLRALVSAINRYELDAAKKKARFELKQQRQVA